MKTELTFGQSVRHAREKQNLTQGQLADKVGCALTTICHYESGESIPSVETYGLLCLVLELPVNCFMDSPRFNKALTRMLQNG